MPAFFPAEKWHGDRVTTQTHGAPPSAPEWDQFLSEWDQLQETLFHRLLFDYGSIWRETSADFTVTTSWNKLGFAEGRSGSEWDGDPFNSSVPLSELYLTGKAGTIRHQFLFLWTICWEAKTAPVQARFDLYANGATLNSPARGYAALNQATCTNSYGIARVPNNETWTIDFRAYCPQGTRTITVHSAVLIALSLKAPRLK